MKMIEEIYENRFLLVCTALSLGMLILAGLIADKSQFDEKTNAIIVSSVFMIIGFITFVLAVLGNEIKLVREDLSKIKEMLKK